MIQTLQATSTSRTVQFDVHPVVLEEQNERVKKELKDRLHNIDPFQFEHLAADLLQKIGFESVTVTKRSGDKGIDIVANLTVGGVTNVKTVVQVKRYKEGNRISGSVIRELRGSAEVDQRGLVITTSDFQKDAIEESKAANKMPVSLVNGEKLIQLLVKYGIGVKKEEKTILFLDTEYFDNDEELGERIDEQAKSKSIWPLPGGINNYVESLNEILLAISNGIDTREKLINWLLKEHDNVNSRNTAYGYTNVPKNMGLISVVGGKVVLTKQGKEYLASKDPIMLYSVISEHILAFEEILEYLKTSGGPQNEESVLDFVNENFDVNWTTYAQVNFRLLWLMNLGLVDRDPEGYIAK